MLLELNKVYSNMLNTSLSLLYNGHPLEYKVKEQIWTNFYTL